MANKLFHKGWLYERDGVKFSPYALKECIIERDGTNWPALVDTKIDSMNSALSDIYDTTVPGLERQIGEIADRATSLEERTQYMDATAADTLYVTDASGNIALKVDGDGSTSFNFITPNTDLNSLANQTESIDNEISNIYSTVIPNLESLITALQERTRFMDASIEDDTFYIVDGNGNIAAKIDKDGITSFNFISQDVNDFNTLNTTVINLGNNLDALGQQVVDNKQELDGELADLTDRVYETEVRTKYVNASNDEATAFYVVDAEGDIGMVVNEDGVTSFEFIAGDMQIKKTINEILNKNEQQDNDISNVNTNLTSLINTTKNNLESQISTTKSNLENQINTVESNINSSIDQLEDSINRKNDSQDDGINDAQTRLEALETRTFYMDASAADGFYITDNQGRIGMSVTEQGVMAMNYYIKAPNKTEIPLIGYEKVSTIKIN